MLDSLPFFIYAVDIETNRLVYGNHAFIKAHPDWQEKPCYQLINGLEQPCFYCRRTEMLDALGKPNGATCEYEIFNEVDDRWYQMCTQTIIWEDGRVVQYVTALDISDLKQTQNQLAEAHATLMLKYQELEHIANTDSLTQIYNREKLGRIFSRELAFMQQGQERLSIISIDLDHFKQINDTFGHATGDAVLVKIARTLKNSLRATDFIGRWGGEEFLILCPQTSHQDAMQLAERVRISVAEQAYPTEQVQSISVGVASFRDGDSLDSLLHRADLAMYLAKQSGRNRVCSETQVTP
jgi:diguanylate cyclase (GGDEF)-like protein